MDDDDFKTIGFVVMIPFYFAYFYVALHFVTKYW